MAVLFDASSSEHLTGGAFINVGSAFTVAGWFRRTATTQTMQTFLGYRDGSTGWRVGLSSSNSPMFTFWGDNHHAPAADNFPNGVWKHWCVTWNGSLLTFYIDGVSVGTVDPGDYGVVSTISYTSFVGSYSWNGSVAGEYANGKLAEVGIWNVVLDAGQISGSSGLYVSAATGNAAASVGTPVAAWSFDYTYESSAGSYVLSPVNGPALAFNADDGLTINAGGASVVISNAGDEAYDPGETGITITGTGFGTGGGSSAIIISPTDNVANGSAVTQTETGTRTATSATFTAVLGSLARSTNLYLFVKDSDGFSNANGHVVQFNAAATVKKLKLLVSSAAIGATVDGVVFTAPVSGIVGAEIGEFTGKTIAAGTGADEGKGVLLIPVTDFGGSALAVFAEPRVYLKNTTHFTPIWPGQVIEE